METLLWTQLNISGECPASYSIGDWSDGSGECCCDPYNQPDEGDDGQSTGETPIPLPTGSTPTPAGLQPYLLSTKDPTGETPIPLSTGETPIPLSTGETPIPLSTGSTPTPSGLTPYLLSSVDNTKEPVFTTTASPTDPPPTLPSVPDYEPSSKPAPLKFCKCRPGVSTSPAPTTPGLVPYLLSTKKPGVTPFLLSSTSSTTRHPHLMTTRSPFGFTGMTSGSPSRQFRRRGQFLKMFV